MDISWEEAHTFLAVAEGGSISAGAQRLGLGQPTVSRRVAQMEALLGCALFIRSKQGVSLTEAGARLLPAAEQMARWAKEFERLASGEEDRPAGNVRIAAPPGIAVDLLPRLSARLLERHPDIRLEVLASVDHVDLTRGGADLAIRTRAPNEPELMTLASGTNSIGVFASRSYIEQLETRLGRTVRDSSNPLTLDALDWVTWSRPYEHVPPRPMLERAIRDFIPAFASDNYLVLRRAVSAGLGAMILDHHGATASARGEVTTESPEELIEIPLGFSLPPNAFHLVCAKSMQFVPRVRAVAVLVVSMMGVVSEAESLPDGSIGRVQIESAR